MAFHVKVEPSPPSLFPFKFNGSMTTSRYLLIEIHHMANRESFSPQWKWPPCDGSSSMAITSNLHLSNSLLWFIPISLWLFTLWINKKKPMKFTFMNSQQNKESVECSLHHPQPVLLNLFNILVLMREKLRMPSQISYKPSANHSERLEELASKYFDMVWVMVASSCFDSLKSDVDKKPKEPKCLSLYTGYSMCTVLNNSRNVLMLAVLICSLTL